ncbi:MAG: toll/interleukin-1 receptor domain-containing protein [Syntrophaceae bacterium]
MTINIFLSYAREDFERVKIYFDVLDKEKRFSPWMDKGSIPSGKKWEEEIKKAIDRSQVILFFISKNTTKSDKYFHKEMYQALAKKESNGILLIIPAFLESASIPAQLKDYHGVELYDNNGINKIIADIKDDFKSDFTDVNRVESLPARGVLIDLPCFFPSISSTAKSTLSVIDHFEVLLNTKYPYFLISAYDIYKLRKNKNRKINALLKKAKQQDTIMLLDSGNYERYWLDEKFLDINVDDFWSEEKLISILSKSYFDFAFNYDNLKPDANPRKIIPEIELSVINNQEMAKYPTILPIIHSKKPEHIPKVCKEVATRLEPLFIAVPERELGVGIVARAKTVTLIRKELNSTGKYYPLHILGTGNPITLLILSACGADSFDGLEWCQTAVDHNTGLLYHSNLVDFFLEQTPIGSLDIAYAAKLLSHNLTFYKNWMAMIREGIKSGKIIDIVNKYLPVGAYEKLNQEIPEVLIQ